MYANFSLLFMAVHENLKQQEVRLLIESVLFVTVLPEQTSVQRPCDTRQIDREIERLDRERDCLRQF
jgi:hypothetical protein